MGNEMEMCFCNRRILECPGPLACTKIRVRNGQAYRVRTECTMDTDLIPSSTEELIPAAQAREAGLIPWSHRALRL